MRKLYDEELKQTKKFENIINLIYLIIVLITFICFIFVIWLICQNKRSYESNKFYNYFVIRNLALMAILTVRYVIIILMTYSLVNDFDFKIEEFY